MVRILDTYNKLSLKDIDIFQSQYNIELTNNYITFLLRWNGGTPSPEMFIISDEEGPTVMNYFYSIGDTQYNLEDHLDIYEFRLPNSFIPIGDDPGGNAILLGTRGPYYDHIYFWDHEQEPGYPDMSNMYFLANDIWEFLDHLYENEIGDNEE